ncbi:MAG: DUF4177 domain-containing protein [Chloroflexota bacterium]
MANGYRYKMVSIAPNLVAGLKEEPSVAAAKYLENAVNQYAKEGWEFHRVDHLQVSKKQGCLGIWLGSRGLFVTYAVITFRRPVALSQSSSPRDAQGVAPG